MSKSAGPTATVHGVADHDKDGKNDDDDDDDTTTTTLIPQGPHQLPSYLADAFAELYEEDGLVVLGKGLGCLLLLASFVRFYADTRDGHAAMVAEEGEAQTLGSHDKRKPPPQRPPLVMVLGLSETERNAVVEILQSWGTPPELLPTLITNEAGERTPLYAQGGVVFITSRILVTDLLTHTVTAQQIDGFFVAHAEQITDEATQEAFILRIYHSQKQANGGFVKGFSDDAPGLLSGAFAKVDKVLKAGATLVPVPPLSRCRATRIGAVAAVRHGTPSGPVAAANGNSTVHCRRRASLPARIETIHAQVGMEYYRRRLEH